MASFRCFQEVEGERAPDGGSESDTEDETEVEPAQPTSAIPSAMPDETKPPAPPQASPARPPCSNLETCLDGCAGDIGEAARVAGRLMFRRLSLQLEYPLVRSSVSQQHCLR